MASQKDSKDRKTFRNQDIYSSNPQEQRPANMPPEESEMQVVGEQAGQEARPSKRRKNNKENPFVKKHR